MKLRRTGLLFAVLLASALPVTAQSANRALHEAWFALRVEHDPSAAQARLAQLLARPDLGPAWRARALELETRCRAALASADPTTAALAPAPDLTAAPEAPVHEPPAPLAPARASVAPERASVVPARASAMRAPPGPGPWDLSAPPAAPDELTERPSRTLELEELVRALDRRAALWRARFPAEGTGGVLALVGRRFAGEHKVAPERVYELATASFEHGLRDDPERARTRNDWDLQFGNGGDWFHANMTGGDRSTLEALPEAGVAREGERVGVRAGHRYRLHTLDSNTDLVFELLVLEHEPGAWVVLAWQTWPR